MKRLALGIGSILLAIVLSVVAWRMPGTPFLRAASAEKLPTIVVLPLVDMSIGQTEQALCDGLTEELSNWLAHIPTLRVVARTSAFAFKGKNIDVREIARQLGATHVLEGSLRRSGNEMRITIQLIEAADGLHMWSDSYDLPLGDIFLIEDTVSRSVAEAMHLQLAPDTAEYWAQRRSEEMEAYELYLLGRSRQRKRTAEDNLKAAEFFRRAVAADPQYSLALVGLSETLLNGLSLNRAPLEDVKAEAEPLINRALTISPTLPDALAVKGWLLSEEFRFDEALPVLQRAISINPNLAQAHRFLGDLFDRRADPNSALKHFSTAADLDPMDFISHVFRCQEFIDLGNFNDADKACRRARELDSTNMWGPLTSASLARARGNTADAARWLHEARRLAPTDDWVADQVVDLLLTQGKISEAHAVVRELPGSDGFFARAREARVVLAESDADGLRNWLEVGKATELAVTGAELSELARVQYLAGDPVAARATLTHARRILPLSTADIFDGSQIRYDYSAALFHAGIEIKGGGDQARAAELLRNLDRMLAAYERNGGQHHGLYFLRAASLATQGKKAEAQAALDTAWQRGWRATWRARGDPFLKELVIPGAR